MEQQIAVYGVKTIAAVIFCVFLHPSKTLYLYKTIQRQNQQDTGDDDHPKNSHKPMGFCFCVAAGSDKYPVPRNTVVIGL